MKTTLSDSIQAIDPTLWNSLLADRSCTFSREFWTLVEQSKLNDFSYRHALFCADDGQPLGLASFYTVTTDIAIFAPQPLRAWLSAVRRWFPNFMKLRMLECGTPVILNSPPFVSAPGAEPGAVLEALCGVLEETARREGQALIVIRDFEPNAFGFRPDLEARHYHWLDGLPNTYLDIRWPTPAAYRAGLKSYYRSKLNKHLKRCAAQGIRHEVSDDFALLAETLCQQWLNVHHQADEFQREVLTPEFYRAFPAALPGLAKAVLFYRGEALVGHALLLLDGGLARWLYFGREQAGNDSLYLYAAHAVVETAILHGAGRLEMGLTTYPIKQDLGAAMVPIKMAIKSPLAWLNPWIGRVYPWLNQTPAIRDKAVFKRAAIPRQPQA